MYKNPLSTQSIGWIWTVELLPAQSIAVRKDLFVQIFYNFFLVPEFLKLIEWNLNREKTQFHYCGTLLTDESNVYIYNNYFLVMVCE